MKKSELETQKEQNVFFYEVVQIQEYYSSDNIFGEKQIIDNKINSKFFSRIEDAKKYAEHQKYEFVDISDFDSIYFMGFGDQYISIIKWSVDFDDLEDDFNPDDILSLAAEYDEIFIKELKDE